MVFILLSALMNVGYRKFTKLIWQGLEKIKAYKGTVPPRGTVLLNLNLIKTRV